MPIVRAAPQELARIALIVGLLLYLSVSSDHRSSQKHHSLQSRVQDRISSIRQSISILNASQWGDFAPNPTTDRWLNLTAFRQDDGYAWGRLEAWKARSRIFDEQASGTGPNTDHLDQQRFKRNFYHNLTGIVQGEWVRYTADLDNGTERLGSPANLSALTPGVEWATKEGDPYSRNITGEKGGLWIKFEEKDSSEVESPLSDWKNSSSSSAQDHAVRDLAATMIIRDESSGSEGWDVRLHGAHWSRKGMSLLTTTSEKYAGLFGLPHLTIGEEFFSTSQQLLNLKLTNAAKKLEEAVQAEAYSSWSSNPLGFIEAGAPVPQCEFVVFAHAQPLFDLNGLRTADAIEAHKVIEHLEEELRFPNGAPLKHIPPLQISTVIFSPDCGFILESKGPPAWSPVDGNHLAGRKQEVYVDKSRSWLLALAAISFCQTLLWKWQSRNASTPSTLSRISIQTLAMLLLADGLWFASLLLLSASEPNLFPAALLGSFIALMSLAIGAKFTGSIYSIQEPETQRVTAAARTSPVSRSQIPASVSIAADAASGDESSATQASPTAPDSHTLVTISSDQDIEAEVAEDTRSTDTHPAHPSDFSVQYGRFVLFLTIILLLSLSSWTWPFLLRRIYVYSASFIYLSFWVPQIRRNILRNCRKAMMWRFTIGQSIFRLLPFAYFFLKEDNVLFVRPDWVVFCVLAGWVWIQVWVLFAQEILGPRYGIPQCWTEEGWDYYPTLRVEDVENGSMPLGLLPSTTSSLRGRVETGEAVISSRTKEQMSDGTCSVNCAICLQVLQVHVVGAGEDAGSATTSGVVVMMARRRAYMVTPCRHIFHSACLEGWMKYRLQCPICRENLPPL